MTVPVNLDEQQIMAVMLFPHISRQISSERALTLATILQAALAYSKLLALR
jgi:hypothetical protein